MCPQDLDSSQGEQHEMSLDLHCGLQRLPAAHLWGYATSVPIKKQAHSGFRKYLSAQLPGSLSFSLPSERWLPLPWKLITFSWWCYFSSSPRWSQVSFGNLLMALAGTGDTGTKGEQVMATSWFCKSTNKESILNGLRLTAGLQRNEPGRD